MRLKCTICLSLYERDSEICALLCGHMYHVDCINHWLSTNSSCPSCRKKVQRNKIVEKLYLEHEDPVDESHESLEKKTNELSDVQLKMKQKELEIRTLEGKIRSLGKTVEEKEHKSVQLENKVFEEQILTKNLKKQVQQLQVQQDEVKRAKLELDTMREYLSRLQNVELVVKGSEADVTSMISKCGDGSGSMKDLATFCVTLKRELETLRQTKQRLREENHKQRLTLSRQQSETNQKNEQLKRMEKEVKLLRTLPSPITPQPISRVRYTVTDSPPIPYPTTPKTQDVQATSTHLANSSSNSNVPTLDLDPEIDNSGGNQKRKRNDSVSNSNSDLKYSIRIKSDQNLPKRTRENTDVNAMVMNFGIMQKRTLVNNYNMSVRTGYNGMGSHEKFIASGNSKPKQAKMNNFFGR